MYVFIMYILSPLTLRSFEGTQWHKVSILPFFIVFLSRDLIFRRKLGNHKQAPLLLPAKGWVDYFNIGYLYIML